MIAQYVCIWNANWSTHTTPHCSLFTFSISRSDYATKFLRLDKNAQKDILRVQSKENKLGILFSGCTMFGSGMSHGLTSLKHSPSIAAAQRDALLLYFINNNLFIICGQLLFLSVVPKCVSVLVYEFHRILCTRRQANKIECWKIKIRFDWLMHFCRSN